MGGPKYKAGYTPISDDLCYAFLLEENLDRSFVGEGANGALLKERGQGYGGIWGQVRDSLADDAIVNYRGSRRSAWSPRGTAGAPSSSATPRTPARR